MATPDRTVKVKVQRGVNVPDSPPVNRISGNSSFLSLPFLFFSLPPLPFLPFFPLRMAALIQGKLAMGVVFPRAGDGRNVFAATEVAAAAAAKAPVRRDHVEDARSAK